MLTRAASLNEHIRQAIKATLSSLSFAEFMTLALYHPSLGYYNAESFSIGKDGDFITAPEISPLFAACFANQCIPILNHIKGGSILELGAGSGIFARDLLLSLEKQKTLPAAYYIVEISQSLQRKQRTFLQTHCPQWMDRIVWLSEIPHSFEGVILANEVLDALPVHCFTVKEEKIYERRVTLIENEFAWQLTPARGLLKQMGEKIHAAHHLTEGYESEMNLKLPSFLRTLCSKLEKGVILLSDYGYGEAEYYHPQRMLGTLTCFYQHREAPNPLEQVGLKDITAHVNFTQVAEEAVLNGCQLAGYTNQNTFLIATGLAESAKQLEDTMNEVQTFHLHQAIKQLTWPTEMGERVKVMALKKNYELPLMGFDRMHLLREL